MTPPSRELWCSPTCRGHLETVKLGVSPGPHVLQVALLSAALSSPPGGQPLRALQTSLWENLYFFSLAFFGDLALSPPPPGHLAAPLQGVWLLPKAYKYCSPHPTSGKSLRQENTEMSLATGLILKGKYLNVSVSYPAILFSSQKLQ